MRRALLAPLVAGVLIGGACSGDDDEGSPSDDDFCKDALAFMQDGAAFDDPSSAEGREALEQVADVDPPDEIADDWQKLMDGIEVLSEMGPDAPDTDVPEEVQDMGPASTNVFRYLNEECDLDESG